MKIKDWNADERPREKLLSRGPDALSDAELLAIFIRNGLPGVSALSLSRKALKNFGSLRQLLNATPREFCSLRGMGMVKYVELQAALEVSRRHLYQAIDRGNQLSSPRLAQDFFTSHLRDLSQEVFACLFLDNCHRIIKYEKLFFGTIDSSNVHPREVVRRALRYNAAAVICAHNHPSGSAHPSNSDKLITIRLRRALELIDVRLLDHLIVGDGEVHSLIGDCS